MKSAFTRGEWFKLFLVCAFPLHVWTILMALRDVSWVAERTNAWDALGFSAYALLYTLVESVLLFLFIALINFILVKTWEKDTRFVMLSLLAFLLAGWSIVEQLILVLLYERLVSWLAPLTLLTEQPWIGYAVLGLLVAISAAVPFMLILRSGKLRHGLHSFLDNITLLSGLYLFLDLAALIVILVRNL